MQKKKWNNFICIACLIGVLGFLPFALAAQISQEDVKHSNDYYHKAIRYGSEGKLIEAEGQINKSLEMNKFNLTSASVLKWIEDFKKGSISREYIKCLFESSGSTYRKEFEQAVKKLQAAIQMNPSYPYAYWNIGLLYISLGDYQKAISYYKKAVEINPSAEAYYGLASAYGYAKQHQDVIAYSKKSLEIDPNYPFSYFNLGVAYWSLEQYDKAKENLQKASKLFKKQEDYNDEDAVEGQLERLEGIISGRKFLPVSK